MLGYSNGILLWDEQDQSCVDNEEPPQGGSLSQSETASGLFVVREGDIRQLRSETT